MVIANIGSGIFAPFLALYVKDLGADIGQVGIYFTIMAVAPVAFRILGGWISDNLGRVQTVALGSVAGLAGFSAFWLAPTWGWLIPAGLLMDLGRALVGTSFRAYTAESAKPEVRAQVIGFTDSVFMICRIIGPPLGGYIAQFYNYRALFGVALLFMAVATALRAWNTRDLPFHWGKLQLARLKAGLGGIGALLLGGGLLTWILGVDLLRDMSYSLSLNFFSLYQKDIAGLSDGQIGWLSSIGAVTMALLMTLAGRLADRIGEHKVMVLGGLVDAVALVVFVNVRSFPAFVLVAVLMSTGWSLFGPAYNSLLSKAVPPDRLGITYGLFETTASLLGMPAPAIGAQLWQHVSPQFPFYLTVALNLLTLVPIWLKFRLPAEATEPKKE
jgi:MFS family permease